MDIVVCTSPNDRARAKTYVHGLTLEGYRAWSDQDLLLGHSRHDLKANRLAAAKANIVLWTEDSVRCRETFSAANRALAASKLIPIVEDKLTALDLPMPHDGIHFARFGNIEPVRHALGSLGVAVVGNPWKPLLIRTRKRLGEGLDCELVAGKFTRDKHWEFEAYLADAPSDRTFAGTRIAELSIKADELPQWSWGVPDAPEKRPDWHWGWLLLQDLLHGLAGNDAKTTRSEAKPPLAMSPPALTAKNGSPSRLDRGLKRRAAVPSNAHLHLFHLIAGRAHRLQKPQEQPMDDIRDFIIEAAGFATVIESHQLEEHQLVFTTLLTKPGEEHRLEVTIKKAPKT